MQQRTYIIIIRATSRIDKKSNNSGWNDNMHILVKLLNKRHGRTTKTDCLHIHGTDFLRINGRQILKHHALNTEDLEQIPIKIKTKKASILHIQDTKQHMLKKKKFSRLTD